MTNSETTATTASESRNPDIAPEQTLRWPVALVGAFVASLGFSGLIDDSGLIEHPWWAVVLVAAVAGSVLGIIISLRSLAQPPRK